MEKLEEIKEKVEQFGSSINIAEGRKQELMGRLLEDYGCSSVEEAQQKLQRYNKSVVKNSNKLDELFLEIEKLLPEDNDDK